MVSPKAGIIKSECELSPGTASPGLAGSPRASLLCLRAFDGQAPPIRDPASRKKHSGKGEVAKSSSNLGVKNTDGEGEKEEARAH